MTEPLVFTVSKADPVGKEPTVGAILNITADLPIVRDTLPRAIWRAANIDRHVQDAQQVVAALAALPQGTVDQVLVLLLQQRASLLRVAAAPPLAVLPDESECGEIFPESPSSTACLGGPLLCVEKPGHQPPHRNRIGGTWGHTEEQLQAILARDKERR